MRNLIYIAGVLSMLTAPGSCQSCNGLKRDIEGCPEVIGTVAQEVAQENYCLRKDNPLSSFLSCAADKNGKNVNLCRNTDDGNRNSNEDYLYQAGTCARPAYTTQPKTLLLESITQSSSNICGVEWYIKNCPENDPRYLECLCQGLVQQHFLCMAKPFLRSPRQLPTCRQWVRAKRATTTSQPSLLARQTNGYSYDQELSDDDYDAYYGDYDEDADYSAPEVPYIQEYFPPQTVRLCQPKANDLGKLLCQNRTATTAADRQLPNYSDLLDYYPKGIEYQRNLIEDNASSTTSTGTQAAATPTSTSGTATTSATGAGSSGSSSSSSSPSSAAGAASSSLQGHGLVSSVGISTMSLLLAVIGSLVIM